MKTPDIIFAEIAALPTPAAKDAYVKALVTDAYAELTDKEKALADLQAESVAEIEKLSKELTAISKESVQALIAVVVDGVRYTTPAGRKYSINHVEVKAEDLVKNVELCRQLIGRKSEIFTESK